MTFREWLELHEKALNSAGLETAPTAVAVSAGDMAQQYLGNRSNTDEIGTMVGSLGRPGFLRKQLAKAGTQAVSSNRVPLHLQQANALDVSRQLATSLFPTKPNLLKMKKK